MLPHGSAFRSVPENEREHMSPAVLANAGQENEMSKHDEETPDDGNAAVVGGRRALWTVRDVATYARCSPRTVSNLMLAGMPFMKLGHLVRFDPEDVRAWIRGRE